MDLPVKRADGWWLETTPDCTSHSAFPNICGGVFCLMCQAVKLSVEAAVNRHKDYVIEAVRQRAEYEELIRRAELLLKVEKEG